MNNDLINGYRISPQQKMVWLLQQGGSDGYRSVCSVSIEGSPDIALLRSAVELVVERHEILRTRFTQLSGLSVPLQTISESDASGSVHWNHVCDLTAFAPEDRSRVIASLVAEARQQPMDFENGRLFHLWPITLSESSHVLIISLPALCADAKSLVNLVDEISRCYDACALGKEVSGEVVQYADVSEALNELIESDDTEAGKQYWRRQDFSSLAGLKLPIAGRAGIADQVSSESLSLPIDDETATRLEALAEDRGSSVSTIMLAAWQSLLWRLSGQQEMIVGTAFDGRTSDELREAVGLFAKHIPIACRFDDASRFSEILERVNEAVEGAYDWQDYFSPEYLGDQTPGGDENLYFFPFGFEYIETGRAQTAQGLTFSLIDCSSCFDTFSIKLSCIKSADGLLAQFHFDQSRLPHAYVASIADSFITLVDSICTDAEREIRHLDVLSAKQKQALIYEFNQTREQYSDHLCLHELFEQQAQRTPELIAVECEGERLSYEELDRRANQLGHYLREQGVGPEGLVGVMMDRGVEMVVGLLGVLKAGGAYVPIEVSWPEQRVKEVIEGAGIGVVVSERKQRGKVREQGVRIVEVDEEREEIIRRSEERVESGVREENVAYVIYTSGSTGKPKGVMIEHRAICNRLRWAQQTYPLNGSDRVLQQAPFVFDFSVWEFFAPLMAGARLVLLQPGGHQDSSYVVDLMARQKVSVAHFVPSMLQVILDEPGLDACKDLRLIFSGGEALSASLRERFHSRVDATLYNQYGPTEASVDSTFYLCDKDFDSDSVPIGRPIANTQTYILDSQLQPVPFGVPGELHIGGEGLARGYVCRPEITSDLFIPNPYGRQPGARMYKTGDLARIMPDGNIEYLGRIGNQVKLRGNRIELGEIEIVLMKHESVREAIALVREDIPGNKRLVAYVVPQPDCSPSNGDLRDHLAKWVPEYMVPSRIMVIDKLPLTPNGKVDRKALPAPDSVRQIDGLILEPQSPNQRILAEIFCQVLRLDAVSIHDNFFDLGGDSILSIQIVARANQRGLRLTAKQVFQHQSVAELAEVAASATTAKAEQGTVSGTVPVTAIQGWFFEQELEEMDHFNQSILLEVSEELNVDDLDEVIKEIVAHHDALRMSYRRAGDRWEQINLAQSNAQSNEVRVERVDLSSVPEAEQKEAMLSKCEEAQRSLKVSEGRMMKVRHFNLGEGKTGRLLIVIHHLVVDGVSWRILLEDIKRGVKQKREGEEVSFGAKTSSFKQWAESLQAIARGEEIVKQLDYWCEPSRKKAAAIPVDHHLGENLVESSRSIVKRLGVDYTKQLLTEVSEAYHTRIDEVLIAALWRAMSEWTRGEVMIVDMEGHGREERDEEVDVTRTVGWMTSLYPLKVEMRAGAGDEEVIKGVKEQVRGVPEKGTGYGLLKYMRGEEEVRRRLEEMPEAEVSFNYLGQLDQMIGEGEEMKAARESGGAARSEKGERNHLVEISGLVLGGELNLYFNYSENKHRRETIERVAESYIQELKKLIDHCKSPDAAGFTPSDFPEIDLNQQELDELIAKYGEVI